MFTGSDPEGWGRAVLQVGSGFWQKKETIGVSSDLKQLYLFAERDELRAVESSLSFLSGMNIYIFCRDNY